MLFSGIIAALTSLLIPIIILLLLLPNACYVVEQQHAVIIERLGKFNRIVNAGFHMKVPVIDRKAATVSLRTMKNGFGIDVKTQDNVTIGLEVSVQYHVSYEMGAGPADSGPECWRRKKITRRIRCSGSWTTTPSSTSRLCRSS